MSSVKNWNSKLNANSTIRSVIGHLLLINAMEHDVVPINASLACLAAYAGCCRCIIKPRIGLTLITAVSLVAYYFVIFHSITSSQHYLCINYNFIITSFVKEAATSPRSFPAFRRLSVDGFRAFLLLLLRS